MPFFQPMATEPKAKTIVYNTHSIIITPIYLGNFYYTVIYLMKLKYNFGKNFRILVAMGGLEPPTPAL